MEEKYVYSFEEGKKEMKNLLGGKGANLAEMTNLGLPVPFGFTITANACLNYYKNNKKISPQILSQLNDYLFKLEEKLNKKLGDEENPLLVSVRSGSAASMPGMMDTILNLGLNDKSVLGLAKKTNNERFAWDSYRRFIQMFGNVVIGVKHHIFEEILDKIKKEKNINYDNQLNVEDLKKIVEDYKKKIKELKSISFPQNPQEQLLMAINAVFDSWNNPRAITYRKLNNISHTLGTAVNIQSMVFGNMGNTSGTGVCFSRNPSNGEKEFYGEYLLNSQGEDVVAGIRTPRPLIELKNEFPKIYDELVQLKDKLENHYKDMQDMEFTIEEGKLYFLQTRNGKRTAHASIKIAVDLVEEGLITKQEALLRIDANSLDQILHKTLDEKSKKQNKSVAKGLPASPGAAVGKISFNAKDAFERKQRGENVILVRTETSPEDIEGMNSAVGILTSRGGMTSHAAVVARGMGKCCVAGCFEAKVNEKQEKLIIGNSELTKNDFISIDGSTGEVFIGEMPLTEPKLSDNFNKIMIWSDEIKKLDIRTNADTASDAQTSLRFNAVGIGLCRTEHMFFGENKIKAMREMILSSNYEGRKKALDKLLPFQKQDFVSLFEVMKEKPVTIRLLDPPLHEFLPAKENEILELSKEMNIDEIELKKKIKDLHENNPMLGHRGCRLGISYPEITQMQARAIFESAKQTNAKPEIMIPFVGDIKEFENQKKIIDEVARELNFKNYKVGTMIEIPRAALTADKIAKSADFFSFGTNDLTQMTLGLSRDDAGKFIIEYLDKDIYSKDPFQAIDQEGMGQLMKIAIRKGRYSNKELKIGICGEHAGEHSSIEFCHKIGLNYVSCSPYRISVARLAAAQAQINFPRENFRPRNKFNKNSRPYRRKFNKKF